ncbi:hypothetical protein BpHYR1_047051 [Brachionus plicatilis]|uniref:Uncharacterized protein n=1 Tax=Brachionus plicatilis TaxID=10195 RepID=A0A3M7RY04_BRAPC|nr:hypothetical protein BpHYR1_047051 [Brachionus plicatilis]
MPDLAMIIFLYVTFKTRNWALREMPMANNNLLEKTKMIEKIQKIEDALINPSNNAVQQQNLDLREKFTNHLCQHFKKDLKIDDFSIEND